MNSHCKIVCFIILGYSIPKLTIDNYTEVVQGIFDKIMIEILIVGWKNIYGMEEYDLWGLNFFKFMLVSLWLLLKFYSNYNLFLTVNVRN